MGVSLVPPSIIIKVSHKKKTGTDPNKNPFYHCQSSRDKAFIHKWEQREQIPVVTNSSQENFCIFIFKKWISLY